MYHSKFFLILTLYAAIVRLHRIFPIILSDDLQTLHLSLQSVKKYYIFCINNLNNITFRIL